MRVPRAKGLHHERGLALVLVLWAVALLAVMAASQFVDARSSIALVRNQVAAAKAQALADAGIYRGILELKAGRASGLWPSPETVVQWPWGGGIIRIRVENEFGKLDLNFCAPSLLKRLITGLGVQSDAADHLVDSIEDFRDRDDLRRPNGAEAADYAAAGLPYGPKNGPFDSVEELKQVLGMTPALYARLSPYLTVFSGRGYVDTAAASPGLVRLLGTRAGEGPRSPSGEETAPVKAAMLLRRTGTPFSASGIQVYTVHSEARVGSLTEGERATVVLSQSAHSYTVVRWREGEEHLFGRGG